MNNLQSIQEVLDKEGVFVSTTAGMSMYPMLRERKDTIVIRTYEGRLRKFDVPLYRKGSQYILHRIIEVRPDSYVMRGDNCDEKEYGITDEDILGVLTEFYRGERPVDMNGWKYQMYVQLYCRLFFVQWIWRRARNFIGKLRRVFRKEEKDV